MDWETVGRNWELILAVVGVIFGSIGHLRARVATKKLQDFFEEHFYAIEKDEKEELEILNEIKADETGSRDEVQE